MIVVRQIGAWIVLAGLFLRELALSVWDVTWIIVYPPRAARSGIVAVPLDVRSDAGIVLFANLITLTPGTISLHIAEDRSVIYVHVMNLSDESVEKLKRGLEHRVMEVLP